MYVHSILHYWVCILMFESHLIEYVCLWEFVCELSKALHFLYSFCRVFWEWGEWLSLRSSVSWSFPSFHSLTMWLNFMLDLSRSPLLFVFFVSPSFSFFAFESSISFHPLSFSYSDPFPGLLLSLHHHYTSHYRFDFLHCLVIVIIFTLGTLGSMAHEIFCTCCISYMRAWVFLSLGI